MNKTDTAAQTTAQPTKAFVGLDKKTAVVDFRENLPEINLAEYCHQVGIPSVPELSNETLKLRDRFRAI